MTTPADPLTIDAVIAEMERTGRLAPACKGCVEHYTALRETGRWAFSPPHRASAGCESGRHPHCTCDRCF